jgi:hypothetical protein
MGICTAQEEEGPVITILPDGDKPVVFPEAMQKASDALLDIFTGNESDHLQFLSDDYWPIPLNNSSILNLTA